MTYLYYVFGIFCKLHIPKYRNCNTQFSCNTNVIPVTSLCNMLTVMMLGISSHWKGIHGLKQAQACCSLKFCWLFISSVGLSHVCIPPTLVWLTQAFTFFWWNRGETHHQLIHSTDTVVYPKQRPPSSPHCAEVKLASLQQLWLVTPYFISWASWAYHACPSPLSLLL